MIKDDDPRIIKILAMLAQRECTRKELMDALDLRPGQLENLMTIITFRFPVYEEQAVYGMMYENYS